MENIIFLMFFVGKKINNKNTGEDSEKIQQNILECTMHVKKFSF